MRAPPSTTSPASAAPTTSPIAYKRWPPSGKATSFVYWPTMPAGSLEAIRRHWATPPNVSPRWASTFAAPNRRWRPRRPRLGPAISGQRPAGQRRGTELAARCQAPATPELVGSAGPVPLTNREREIALLAADGLTTRVIAERLYLSARTVDNHLARIYTKLGITNRSELAATLRR